MITREDIHRVRSYLLRRLTSRARLAPPPRHATDAAEGAPPLERLGGARARARGRARDRARDRSRVRARDRAAARVVVEG